MKNPFYINVVDMLGRGETTNLLVSPGFEDFAIALNGVELGILATDEDIKWYWKKGNLIKHAAVLIGDAIETHRD